MQCRQCRRLAQWQRQLQASIRPANRNFSEAPLAGPSRLRYEPFTPAFTETESQYDDSRSMTFNPALERIRSHFDALLDPLEPMPASLALRIATHKSAAGAHGNHNARLSFIGRRVLKTSLALFLSQNKQLFPAGHLNTETISRIVDTYELGKGVGAGMKLEEAMRWTQVFQFYGPDKKSTGLWKVRGETVQALIGGVWTNYGGATAMHTSALRILPALDYSRMVSASGQPPEKEVAQEIGGRLADSARLAAQDRNLLEKGTSLLRP